ncbi:tetratricopeptide repeat protein [Roseateles oligotrophus]|uniref:ABC transporter permease n=1 Tax=Roseateles oligotrophus TaxID=1769250 RepID=A0ABT2YFE9_9BURK|nr:ABC transporter permease [Roseateles oligotrophus]MCV2368746.1 ABC transporter permease [Roseateles oligotrophus]
MKIPSTTATISTIFSILITLSPATQANTSMCGELENGYGPWDVRSDLGKLQVVYNYHFSPAVESLTKSMTSSFGADIGYTLRAIPNQPKALLAMIRLGEREKRDKPIGSIYTVECWLDRAIRFRPDDNIVRMIYAGYLGKNKRKSEALQHLDIILAQTNDNPFTLYNLGMIYADLGEFKMALKQAHRASSLGFKNTGLRKRLEAAGEWNEDEPTASSNDSGNSEPKMTDERSPSP